jgi:hypothetical protein
MSGAPLLKVGSLDLVGMIYGTNDVETNEAFRIIDPETGATKPEVLRITSFGLAHQASTLAAASGPATDNKRPGDVVVHARS